jgi:hypothetical protein
MRHNVSKDEGAVCSITIDQDATTSGEEEEEEVKK